MPVEEFLRRVRPDAHAQDQIIELRPNILLLVDIGWPSLNLQGIERIKREAPTIGVAILTSRVDDEYASSVFQSGADTYCLATVTREQFYMALKSTSYGASWIDPGVADKVLHHTSRKSVAPPASRTVDLSAREQEVLQLLVEGLSNKEMALRLVVSIETVKSHVRHLMKKLEAKHRTQVVVQALHLGIIAQNQSA